MGKKPYTLNIDFEESASRKHQCSEDKVILAVHNRELGENTTAVFHLLLNSKLAMKYKILYEGEVRPLNVVLNVYRCRGD